MTSVISEPGQGVQAAGPTPSRPAPAPVAAAGASRAAVVLAIGVTAIGGVAVRDALVALGWVGGAQWLPPVIDAVDGLAPRPWMVAAGAALTVVGLLLMVVALLPRRRTAVALTADSAVYLHAKDVAKLASAAAGTVPGVLEARTTSSRRKAVVRCRVTGATREVRDAVTEAVSRELAALQNPPRTVVHVRTESTS
jgi:hypothetical protein